MLTNNPNLAQLSQATIMALSKRIRENQRLGDLQAHYRKLLSLLGTWFRYAAMFVCKELYILTTHEVLSDGYQMRHASAEKIAMLSSVLLESEGSRKGVGEEKQTDGK